MERSGSYEAMSFKGLLLAGAPSILFMSMGLASDVPLILFLRFFVYVSDRYSWSPLTIFSNRN